MSTLDKRSGRAEDALRESEKRLRAIWETAVEGIITIDEQGVIESLNPAACRIFGYTPVEVIGRNVSTLMPSPDRERHDSYLANYLRTGHAKIIGIGREVTGLRRDGTTFPMDLSVSEVRLGERRLFSGLVRDISERKQAEAALREGEQRLRAIMETAVDGIITIDERGLIESLNPAACRIFGYELRELLGRNVKVLMPPPYHEQHDGYLTRYLHTGEARIIGIGREVTGLRQDGTTFPMHLSVCEVRLGERRLFTGFVRDISERRQLEQAVAAAAEQERAHLARELHDGLGQQLGGLLFMMNGLCRDLQSARAREAETAKQLSQELATAIAQARALSHELYAVPPEPDGLAEALGNLADRVAGDGGVACAFKGETSILVHQPATASHLYRITQEAVQNALKHSRATRIEIEMALSAGGLTLAVRDNGIGFPAQRSSQGIGLHTMEQRAKLISGQLTARARPEGGVEVICSVPETMLAKTAK
ncbi:MAG: PAS domain S-box protein [Verrucomicrobiota bacterium]|nr:PAS domain S-box protein [Verrucomicrobiota bacterium]